MRIKHVKINYFRGISKLEWTIQSPLTCLIGPGDSGKTTILDAIELALLPRWNYTFEDCDFHESDISKPIEIRKLLGSIIYLAISFKLVSLHAGTKQARIEICYSVLYI